MTRPSWSMIIEKYPIGDSLDAFRDSYNAFDWSDPEGNQSHFIAVPSSNSLSTVQILAVGLIEALKGLQASSELPSISNCENLYWDLLQFLLWVVSNDFDFNRIQPVVDAVLGGKPDEQIWSEVYRVLEAQISQRDGASERGVSGSESHILAELYKSWQCEYVEGSLLVLDEMLRNNERKMKNEARQDEFYGRTLIFVQSSGMGKSRLADKYGETHLMVNFILGEPGRSGYPPSDHEVLKFMRQELPEAHRKTLENSPSGKKAHNLKAEQDKKTLKKRKHGEDMTEEESENPKHLPEPGNNESPQQPLPAQLGLMIWYHCLSIGLLQASFEKLHDWVKDKQQKENSKIEDLAKCRHKLMAPFERDQDNMAKWDERKPQRVLFCKSVVARAQIIAESLFDSPGWRHLFYDAGNSQVLIHLEDSDPIDHLKNIASELISDLQLCRADGPLLVVVFDEAASLLTKPGSEDLNPGLYHALNRVISYLKKLSIWFFFLSTEPQIRMLLPEDDEKRSGNYSRNPSARLEYKSNVLLQRFPPFLDFQLDVEDRRRMADKKKMEKELAKSFAEFEKQEHMAMFGRPLWYGYKDPKSMRDLAKRKLLGGRYEYDGFDVNDVFAALSFRVSLDVCLQNPRTIELNRTAVNFYMRVAISMDPETGVMETVTPSEPVLAKAAMAHLCKGNNWSRSIDTLTSKLLNKGLIEKGVKGELYARLVLILARDALTHPDFDLPKPSFTVSEFLASLYGKEHDELLAGIPTELRDAWMNFNHFTTAGETLKPELFPRLWHELLRRNAGMQLAHNQPTYDIMIPIYFGSQTKPFNLSDCGTLLIHVTNKEDATTPDKLFNDSFLEQKAGIDHPVMYVPESSRNNNRGENFIFNKTKHPILVLIFDLSAPPKSKASPVQLYKGKKDCPPLWVIHSHGHNYSVFGCLRTMYSVDSCNGLFVALSPDKSLHSQLSERNILFSKLEWNHRYQVEEKSEEEKGGEENDEEATMKDV